mmetsp:Transcript_72097/g.185993  ORF Transcript_72097/g.185993 Transcript_72097/m.185993 type:complete len:262 (-) Transcript_72097:37-822(-)
MRWMHRPVSTSQTLALRLRSTVVMVSPSGVKVAETTASEWPSRVCKHSPVFILQSFAVLSAEHVTISLAFGEKHAKHRGSSWPLSVPAGIAAIAFQSTTQILAVPSSEAVSIHFRSLVASTEHTAPLCPRMTNSHSPVAAFQSLADLSLDAVITAGLISAQTSLPCSKPRSRIIAVWSTSFAPSLRPVRMRGASIMCASLAVARATSVAVLLPGTYTSAICSPEGASSTRSMICRASASALRRRRSSSACSASNSACSRAS